MALMIPKKPRPRCENGCGKNCTATKGRFCSTACSVDYDFKIRVLLLESGQYPPGIQPRWIRKYLVWKFGEQCSKCGWAERHPTTGKIPIEVEHIDGNAKNNYPENLVLLCPNCHSLTATYRALNRGKGSELRLGGRENPLRGDAPAGKSRLQAETPFPIPRTLVELVEAKLPTPSE